MNLISAAFRAWMAVASGMPEGYEHPRISFVPQQWIGELRYPHARRGASNDVVAVYADDIKTIYLSEDWNALSPGDLSILVHEFVHHVQNEFNLRYACPAEREAAAYALQSDFLGLFGKSLESEYDIDPFTLMVRTKCLPM